MNHQPKHIYISAGEASGDLLGADLVKALLRKDHTLKLTGMGGPRMAQAGVDLKFDAKRLSVVGFIEVFTHLPSIFFTLRAIKKYLTKEKPELLILIDFPDTHFRLCEMAKKLNIPVLYYVSPQIWAWRANRIHHMKEHITHIAVLFAFEEKLYQQARIPVTMVGHPLAQIVKPSMEKSQVYRFFNLDPKRSIVALFPGSRPAEMERHLSIIIAATREIATQLPDTQFVLLLATHLDEKHIRAKIPSHIKIITQQLYDLLQITDAAVAVSGTVTLEIALMQVPLCIIYQMNPWSYALAKRLIKVDHIGLCNIVAKQAIAKELIQTDVTPQNIAAEITRLLTNTQAHQQQQTALATIKNALGDGNPSEKVATIAMNMLIEVT